MASCPRGTPRPTATTHSASDRLTRCASPAPTADRGGSARFVSDANWGPDWTAAAKSDNQLLTRYGAQVYQDSASGVALGAGDLTNGAAALLGYPR